MLVAVAGALALLALDPSTHASPHPLGSATSGSAYWYSCPPGLVQTGTADGLANGRYCAFWLLKSFPLGGAAEPGLNDTAVPGLDVLGAWSSTQGAGVTVAVIDSGVDGTSRDLAPNLATGFDFYDRSDDTSDRAGHGTLLASIIAAPAGNGGYVGIAPRATIVPVKVLGGPAGDGWSDRALVDGVEYALRRGARVLNLSLGGLDTPIAGMQRALAAARRAGALVVIAAGNDGADLDGGRHTEYPDGYGLPNTLTVANFTNRGSLAADSNYGAHHVQIASLGADLWGDYPGHDQGGYLGGSSAAAATVSGVAALLFAADPAATAAQVRRAIIVGANRDVTALRGKVEADGLLSAPGALAALSRPDTGAPAAFRAWGPRFAFRTSTGRRTVLAWRPSSDPELEGYTLTLDGKTTTLPATATRFAVALRPGWHTWSVSAYDLSGNRTGAAPAAPGR